MPQITSKDIKTTKVIRFNIPYNEPLVNNIVSDLNRAEMPYLFVNKDGFYAAYVHKGKHTWKDVLNIVQTMYNFEWRYTQCWYHPTTNGGIKLIY
jgi:hypothetical protein